MRVWFADEAEEKQWKRCVRLLDTAGRRKEVRVQAMREAVSELAAQGEQEFEQLNDFLDHEQAEEFIRARFGQDLRPPMEGCVLWLQVDKHLFAGYYPRLLTQEQIESKKKGAPKWPETIGRL